MSSPTRADVHVNRPLTNIAVAYVQDEANFDVTRIFPEVPVAKQSDRYFTYNKDDFFRDEAQERAPGAESSGSGYDVDNTPTYFSRVYAHHKKIDAQTRANMDAPLNPDRDATIFVTQKLLLRRMRLWVNNYFGTGKWGTDLTGVAGAPAAGQFKQWDQAGSTPVKDVNDQAIAIAESTGYKPNKLVLGPYAFNALCEHADILDRVKYTQRGQITAEILASLFNVDQVIVPLATENTAAKGAAGAYSFHVGKSALLVYANPAPSILQPSGGYTFAWTGYLGNSPRGFVISSWWDQDSKSDKVEGEAAFDMKLISADVGAFFDGVIA